MQQRLGKHVQSIDTWAVVHLHIKATLPAAHRAVVGRRPRQPHQFEGRLHQAQGLAQRRAEQTFDGQAKLDGRIREGAAAATLAAWRGKPLHALVHPDG